MNLGNRKLRLAVLVSGGGTNLQALMDHAARGDLEGEIVVVAGDRPDAYGLIRARENGIAAHVVDYKAHMRCEMGDPLAVPLPVDLRKLDGIQKIVRDPDTEKRLRRLCRLVAAEREMIGILDAYKPDYICLAGFMRLLTPYFLGHYNRPGQWRVVNIHPALLPAFPGQHGYEDTLGYGCKWGGITIHFADEGEDSGPVLAQAVYPIWPQDGIDDVRRRGLRLEYAMYAQTINWLAAGQIHVQQSKDGRLRASVSDPRYRDVMRRWVDLAFS
ncbi:MAG: phosphoribosylglycinamide formyltransferase [Syntrophobacteraceae bacterium]|nr:phosphoribosylglycinamide formyltransferase [Desulfobacteraceae bacterium]